MGSARRRRRHWSARAAGSRSAISICPGGRDRPGLGGGTIALHCDVTDRESFAGFLDEAERELGPLDVVVNNAGIMPVTPLRRREPTESVHRQIDINLHGVIVGTQLAIERMHAASLRPHRQHRLAGRQGRLARDRHLLGTKHAVVGLSEAVRAELRGTGVEIACVMPTVVNTELTTGVGQRWSNRSRPRTSPARSSTRWKSALRRLGAEANGALYKFLTLLPRGAREALGRAMKVDKLMTEVDHGARQRLRGAGRPASRVEGTPRVEPSPEA